MARAEAQEGERSSHLPKGCLATHIVAITGYTIITVSERIFDLVEHVVNVINSM